MKKYSLLYERVLADGVTPEGVGVPRAARDDELGLVHTAAYLAAVRAGRLPAPMLRRIGFPWSPEMVERSRRSVGATLEACDVALEQGTGVNLAGGTHHAFPDRGEGYCVFNDAAVAVRALRAAGRVDRVLIVDLDVHQGNGTAAIFAGDPSVVTVDLHGARNFPFEKERATIDIPLPDGTGDSEYLAALDGALEQAFAHTSPDLALYLAGADPFEGDRLGRLALTRSGLAERDRRVLHACRSRGVPVAVMMAGGYAADVRDTIDIHATTVALALRHSR